MVVGTVNPVSGIENNNAEDEIIKIRIRRK
jgi:hypothetical protein